VGVVAGARNRRQPLVSIRVGKVGAGVEEGEVVGVGSTNDDEGLGLGMEAINTTHSSKKGGTQHCNSKDQVKLEGVGEVEVVARGVGMGLLQTTPLKQHMPLSNSSSTPLVRVTTA
jgi:hypothetical protein